LAVGFFRKEKEEREEGKGSGNGRWEDCFESEVRLVKLMVPVESRGTVASTVEWRCVKR
jgi:hypothetical protein